MTADLSKRFTRGNIDSIGVMEYWSGGVLMIDPHYSITPTLHYSNR
jgi:hypothetical protein